MSKKITKKSKRRVILVSILTIGLMSFLLCSLFSVWNQILAKHQEKKFYASQLSKLKEDEAYLKVETEKLQDPDYVARYAREQYLYSKDGEFNIRIN